MKLTIVHSVVAALLLSGCATPRYTVQYDPFGEMTDETITANDNFSEKLADMPWDHQYPVKVLSGKLPEGITLSDEGTKITLSGAAKDQYEVLGKLTSKPYKTGMSLRLSAGFWYFDMHPQHSSIWNNYCKYQAPLRAVTLSAWFFLSPFSWVCFPSEGGSRSEHMRLHLQELKIAAFALGANMVILSNETAIRTTHVMVGGGVVAAGTTESPAVELSGFALRLKKVAVTMSNPNETTHIINQAR